MLLGYSIWYAEFMGSKQDVFVDLLTLEKLYSSGAPIVHATLLWPLFPVCVAWRQG